MIQKALWLACLATAIVSCRQSDARPEKKLLENNWLVQSSRQAKAGGAELSQPGADVTGWYKATVPSTVMGVLTANGLYTDALEGMNYPEIDKTLFDTTWWYRTEFDLPALKENEHSDLLIDGISYAANIWLNGQQIATRDSLHGPFRQFRLDITPAVKKGRNVLAVEVFRAQPGEPNIGFVDWNPRPADESMGIFREVRVAVTGEVSLSNSAVRSKVNTQTLDEAWLTLETTLTNRAEHAVQGALKAELEGKTFGTEVSLQPGETRTVRLTAADHEELHLTNPRLWWCRNLGSPEMYNLKVSFATSLGTSDSESIDFGVREVKDYFTEEGHRGFLLNGKKVLVRSAGWTDDIFLRNTPERYETEIQYVCDMNLNSIRFENIWGTSQRVYDLCDRYGLLVLTGWSCHWEWDNYLGSPCDEFGGIRTEADMDLIARSLRDQVLWLRNHPSIIGWFVGSDMMPRPELEKRYMAFLPQIDDRPYISAAKAMTSELTGPSGMKMAGPYEYVAPNYWYSDEAPGGAFGFNTETGIGAQLPVRESLERMIPADKLWPLNEVWNYHCTASGSDMNTLRVLQETIDGRLGKATGLDDFLRKADWLNYEGTRAMYEAFRVRIPRSTGIVQWMLNSAWPSLYWQLYDHYLVPTAAYYSVKKANQPQQLIYDYARRAVFAVNEGAETCRMKATAALYDLTGKVLLQEEQPVVEVAPYTVVKVFDIPVPADNAFLFLTLGDNGGTFTTDNFYCLSARPDVYDWAKTDWVRTPVKEYADFTRLFSLPKADYTFTSSVSRREDGSRLVRVELTNAPDGPVAFFLRLSLKDAQGRLLTPVFWSDNYLSPAPGEKRTVECMVPASTEAEGELTVTVAGGL